MLKTLGIINKALQPNKKKYNIVTFDTHERYQTQLCKTGHNFYSFRYDGCKEWDTNYADVPENYFILPNGMLPSSVEFDFILSKSKIGQNQIAKQFLNAIVITLYSL